MHISPAELKKWKEENHPHLLIDIRESYEIAQCTIGGQPLPMETILSHCQEFPKDKAIVIHCNSGKRSDAATYAVRQHTQREDILSLAGGIQHYAELFEPEMTCAS
ncbi:MAG: hypothetical protein RL521_1055 [Bacteroidota bacterium]|jgi:rhodanese-related sulfurtransferase